MSGAGDQETVTSEEIDQGWELDIDGRRTRTYEIEAALGTLSAGAFRPCDVLAGRRGRAPVGGWRYNRSTGVLKLRLRTRTARLVVRACGH